MQVCMFLLMEHTPVSFPPKSPTIGYKNIQSNENKDTTKLYIQSCYCTHMLYSLYTSVQEYTFKSYKVEDSSLRYHKFNIKSKILLLCLFHLIELTTTSVMETLSNIKCMKYYCSNSNCFRIFEENIKC